MASARETARFARRWNEEIWGERNLDAIDDLVAEDFVGYDASLPGPVRGPEGVRETAEALLAGFPDCEVELEQVVAEGDWVAQRLKASGTHEGEFMGIEPTGEEMEAAVMSFQRVRDGKVVEERQIVDTLGMLAQLGVVELPTQEHARPAIGGDTGSAETAHTNSIEENKRIASRFPEEVATGGHIERIDEICTPDVVEHSPMGERRGREALKEQSEYVHAAFPDVSVTVEDAVAQDDTVAQRLTFRGTHEGEFAGVEPTGNEVEIPNMLFTRIEGGQIAERWLLPDMLGLLVQLGVVEPPVE